MSRTDDEPDRLERLVEDFQPGVYRHYKGQFYMALCLAREDETEEVVVVYTRLYDRAGFPVSTRRLSIWCQDVLLDGHWVPRFAYIGNTIAADGSDSTPAARRGLIGWMKENL